MLLEGRIDIGLIPVALIPKMKEAHILTDYCIGTEGEVASVALFSEVPIEEIDTLLLDYQSRTSVNLAKILLKEYWGKSVHLVAGGIDFRDQIKGKTAGIVIGDRALEQRNISAFTYDLGAAWKALTGLPFVFAAWVANKPIDPDFIDAFNRANAYGVNHLDEVLKTVHFDQYDLHHYYSSNLSYQFTENKKRGLDLFLNKLSTLS
jgi:chorismate dehydratase